MTPTALAYLLLGLATLIWPLATLLLRRHILGAQWLLIAALLLLGVDLILYGCLFNTFLRGEYLLLVLYMAFALFTPPVAVLATAHLTRIHGTSRLSRNFLLLPTATAALLLASFFIGGADMYRLWINRGTLDQAHLLFQHSWRYNLIVSTHYYLFSAILSIETLFLALYSIVHLRRYSRILAEYYSPDLHRIVRHRPLYSIILLLSLILVASTILYPLNTPRPHSFSIITCSLLAPLIAALGYATFNLNHSAETLAQLTTHTKRPGTDLTQLGREITLFVQSSAYLNPELSVFLLASHFHVSQDQVVDAIHRIHGTPFADFLDSVRIEHAAQLLPSVEHPDDPDTLSRIAHQCGYLSQEALEKAFLKVMHTPIRKSGLL